MYYAPSYEKSDFDKPMIDTPTILDDMSMGTEGMKYLLESREAIVDCVGTISRLSWIRLGQVAMSATLETN